MKIKKIIGGIMILLSISSIAHADPIEEGKTLFLTRCAACHNINKVLTGPALAGVNERRSIEWIINFVHSSQTVVKSGDKDAVALFQQFNKIVMPDHPDLTGENIKQIVEYIKTEAKATGKTDAPFAIPTHQTSPYRPLTPGDYWYFGAYLLVVGGLIAALLLAVKVRSLKRPEQ